MTKLLYKYILFFLIATSLFAQNQIRIAGYNVRRYPNPSYNIKHAELSKILKAINPTILVAIELDGASAVQTLLNNTLNNKYKASTEVNITWGTGNEAAVFYRDSLVTYLGSTMIPADTRPFAEFKFVYKPTNDTFYVFGVHLKAEPAETARRLSAVNSLRNRAAKFKPTDNFLAVGDYNIFTSTEPAFQRMLDQSIANPFYDMLNLSGSWNANPAYAAHSTWSTTNLNTRLDMVLVSQTLLSAGGMDYVPNSFKAFGNADGLHYLTFVNNTARAANYWFTSDPSLGDAVKNFSDHLPIFADFSFNNKTNVEKDISLPTSFELSQNYPNPFNPSTAIRYKVPAPSHVTLMVYDVLGNEIATLVDEFKNAGEYHIGFNVETRRGESLQSGVYFYRLTAVSSSAGIQQIFSSTKKMVIIK